MKISLAKKAQNMTLPDNLADDRSKARLTSRVLVMLSLLVFAPHAFAKSIDAEEILTAAAAAHGGADRLADLHSLVGVREGQWTFRSESRWIDAPYETGNLVAVDVYDEKTERARYDFSYWHRGMVRSEIGISGESGGIRGNYRSRAYIEDKSLTFDWFNWFRVGTPVFLLRDLVAKKDTATYLGKKQENGQVFHVIQRTGDSREFFFDAKTSRFSQIISKNTTSQGIQHTTRTLLSDFRFVDGLLVPLRTATYIDGNIFRDIKYAEIKLDPEIGDHLFSLNPILKRSEWTPSSGSLRHMTKNIMFYSSGSGAWGQNLSVVEFNDFLAVVSAAKTPTDWIIKTLQSDFPEKPIRYVILLDRSNAYSQGISAYKNLDVTIIGLKEAKTYFDRYVGPNARAEYEVLDERRVISDGDTQVIIEKVETVGRLFNPVLVYVPSEKIIIGDVSYVPNWGQIPAAHPDTRFLVKSITDRGWEVDTFLSREGKPYDWQDIETSLRNLDEGWRVNLDVNEWLNLIADTP